MLVQSGFPVNEENSDGFTALELVSADINEVDLA